MSEPRRRSAAGRPVRRLRRWARHTPNGDMAVTLISIGLVLIVAAVLILLLA